MAKAKVKKQSTFIDMTAMSDVTVLLLTFFMLTSTFVKKEPITVNTPASVSEIKVPESNSMTILVDEAGKVFFSMDDPNHLVQTAQAVGADYGVSFTDKQIESLRKISSFGVPIDKLPAYLDLRGEEQDRYMQEQLQIENNPNIGIPNDTVFSKKVFVDTPSGKKTYNEFQNWIRHARIIDLQDGEKDLELVIKADKTTSYEVVKNVMNDLRNLRENRYLLVTNLRTASSDK
jgi:biopolymer transport protein ExbD